jgi:RNA polymerase sigma-70 factor (ECF subfamily)
VTNVLPPATKEVMPALASVEARLEAGAASAPLATASFAEIYDQHAPFVGRALLRLGVTPSAVEDAMQETFLVIHRRLAGFEGRSTLRTWIFGIAVRVARTHRRTLVRRPFWRRAASEDEAEALRDDPRRQPDALYERSEANQLLARMLDTLDQDRREVFVLAELEDMTAMEISVILGVSPNTASSRLRLARRDFEKALTREQARQEWRTSCPT